MSTREEYVSRFPNLAAAVEFENGALSVGREFLPPAAVAVLDKTVESPPPEYWDFLIGQIEAK